MDRPRTNPSDRAVVIRPLTPAELARGLELSTEAGWNQNAADWSLLMQLCDGWGAVQADGCLIGTTMAWKPTVGQTWINMVLVATRARGRGVARQLVVACLGDPVVSRSTALLDATDMGAHLYQKLGFSGDREIVRLLRPESPFLSAPVEIPAGLRRIREGDLNAIIEFDAEVSGLRRPEVLKNFYARLPQVAWMLHDEHGTPRGFVLGRDGRVGVQIGPLAAGSALDARRMMEQALANVTDSVLVDVPGSAGSWMDQLHGLGFVTQRRFVRMGLQGVTWPTDWLRYHAISGPDFA